MDWNVIIDAVVHFICNIVWASGQDVWFWKNKAVEKMAAMWWDEREWMRVTSTTGKSKWIKIILRKKNDY